ncbi:MAG: T9SS type A sorting domain-containing protein [Psychroserpens sp.]|uniref:T9SS type A sorting domain-containing protein n=1 Tax=Psychroserpens sp. TaxID=2020870 RepID=UPI003001C38C
MKTNYLIKTIFTLLFTAFISQQVNAQQFKLLVVDPAADTVTIKNFGSTTENIGSYRLCSLITYRTLSSQTTVINGSLNLAPNAEVTVSISGDWLNNTAADLGLYLPTGNFGLAANMVDFVQWGSSPNGRESVAVTKGIWTAGTFINIAPPYEFNGTITDFGVNFWATLLSVDDLDASSSFSVYPNPTNSILNIELNSSQTNLTYQVFDVLGKQVLIETLDTVNLSQIDVSNWNNGLYLIKISNGDKTETKRFIKH